MKNLIKITLIALALPATGWSEITLPPIFSDNMVVQQGVPLTLWGTAEKGEEVTASLGTQEIGAVTADENGRWKITGATPKAGPLPDITIQGSNKLVIRNVLAGEVWLCSGQSNMKMTVSATPECEFGGVINEKEEVAQANHPEIRFFNGKWEICSPETIGRQSGVAYFFGRTLQQDLKVPMGLIVKAIGGTAIEYWMGDKAWTADLQKKTVDAYVPFHQFLQQNYEERLARGEKTEKKKELRPPVTPEKYPRGFSKLFNENIAPLAGYPIRGILWYQGESNTQRAGAYRELLTALIQSWRGAWQMPELPFLIVQLPEFAAPSAKTKGAENWPVIREKQAQVADEVPGAALVVALGAGDPELLHPRNKQEVGARAGSRALDLVYGKKAPQAPVVEKVVWGDSQVELSFVGAEGGLVVKGGPSPAFELAGADGIYHPATATVSAQKVELRSGEVKTPVALRYAWRNHPAALLYNVAGLPVAPFQSKKE